MKEEREVMNLAWKPRGRVDWWEWGHHWDPNWEAVRGSLVSVGAQTLVPWGQQLLPSMLTLPREVWRPAVVSPIAAPALPPGSANS